MEEYRIKAEASMEELRELQKQTVRQLEESDRRFSSQWGKLVESLVEGRLVDLPKARSFDVRGTSNSHNRSFHDRKGRLRTKEFDIVAVTSAEMVVVEVKTSMNTDKVRYFLSAIEDVKRYFHYFSAMRVYGAVGLSAKRGGGGCVCAAPGPACGARDWQQRPHCEPAGLPAQGISISPSGRLSCHR